MTLRLRLALILYRLLWWMALPFVLIYLHRRAQRDPAYGEHMNERWGDGPTLPGAVWVHAVSLGEMRSSIPLVRALLDRGETVVTTHLTPAGRGASEHAFAAEIRAGRLVARYLPFELGPAYRRFLAATKPKLALSLEIEIWPVMIAEAARAGVPLYLANSQIPGRSYRRARRLARLIGHPVAGVSGVFAKSERHAERFRRLGAPDVAVMGELRFDQPVPEKLLAAAARFKAHLSRAIVAVTSVVEGEDEQYLAMYRAVQAEFEKRKATPPLFIHIPRAPERFGIAGQILEDAGQSVVRRSVLFGDTLETDKPGQANSAAILLGDSMGEMYFYLALSDLVVVGGGLLPSGAHNVIEALALKKPVLSGPNIWTIEYPGEEAIAAGILRICDDAEHLATVICDLLGNRSVMVGMSETAEDFFAEHAGATVRLMERLSPLLAQDLPVSHDSFR